MRQPHNDSPSPDTKASPEANDDKKASGNLPQLAAAGFELASFALILGAAGYGIDRWFGNEQPYIGIAGLLLGFCLGFYRLLKLAGQFE